MNTNQNNTGSVNDDNKQEKINELLDIIATAEETIRSARELLNILQPESSTETAPENKHNNNEEEGQVVYGYFDGQIMLGEDGKQYPVPANYASKSKLVEGDKLKLTITPENRFVYKQIGPVERNYLIGIVQKDERDNFTVRTNIGKTYKVLLAAATYFKIEPGDEVTLIVPQNKETVWGAIENVLQKNAEPINSQINNTTRSTTGSTIEKEDDNQKSEEIDTNDKAEQPKATTDDSPKSEEVEKLLKEMESVLDKNFPEPQKDKTNNHNNDSVKPQKTSGEETSEIDISEFTDPQNANQKPTDEIKENNSDTDKGEKTTNHWGGINLDELEKEAETPIRQQTSSTTN